MLALLLLSGLALAAQPFRAPPERPLTVQWEPGLRDDAVIVKLEEGVRGRPVLEGARLRPLFTAPPAPVAGLADLSLYWRVEVAPGQAEAVARAFNEQPWVETAYLDHAPQPPPLDLDPPTPDLSGEQLDHSDAPTGFGPEETTRWPGGDGAGVQVASLEYSWTRGHEDLTTLDPAQTWGLDRGDYAYHGTMVFGILVAQDNGYGMTGLAPAATPVVIHPYTPEGEYNLAAAVLAAGDLLGPGDVLLIEQQIFRFGDYAPVEADPAVFDAITYVVSQGVVVVEPGANGGQDLDDPQWQGWFDRSLRDSGAILVGGGNPPDGVDTPRAWTTAGGSYGARVDVQGWYYNIPTTGDGTIGAYYADLYWPDEDGRQAYTSHFGGTSGASAQVAGVVTVFSAVWQRLYAQAPDPLELRAWLVSTGTPQAEGDGQHIGPVPDLRRLLRYAALR